MKERRIESDGRGRGRGRRRGRCVSTFDICHLSSSDADDATRRRLDRQTEHAWEKESYKIGRGTNVTAKMSDAQFHKIRENKSNAIEDTSTPFFG